MTMSCLPVFAVLSTFAVGVVFGSSSSRCPCDRGDLCPPPAFPDMLAAFQDTLGQSATIRNLTNSLLSSLIQSNCRYSLLTTVDWTDFNARLCAPPQLDSDSLEDPDSDCHHVPYQGLMRPEFDPPPPPLQPFSASKSFAELGDYDDDDDEYYDEPGGDRELPGGRRDEGNWTAVDGGGGAGRKDASMEGWLLTVSTSTRPLPDASDGLTMNAQGIAIVVGIVCSILSLVCGIVILVYIRRRYYTHPKYESPPEEALCLRWMQSRFGVGGGGGGGGGGGEERTRSEEFCYSTSSEERMRTNLPGYPIKRYL